MSFQEPSYEPRFLGVNDNDIPYQQQYGSENKSSKIDSNPSQTNLEPTFKRQPTSSRYEPRFHAHLSKSPKKDPEDTNSFFGQKDCRSKVYHQMLFSNQDNKSPAVKPSNSENIMTEFYDDSEDEHFTNYQPPVHQVPQIPVTKSTPISPRFIINPNLFENPAKQNDNSISTKSNVLKQNAAMFTFQEGKFSMNDSQIQETWKDSKSNPPPLKLSQKPTSKKSARSPRLLADYKQFATNNNETSNKDNNNSGDDETTTVFF